jgi:hypothetical protein
MSTLADRIKLCGEIMALLEERRVATGDETLGMGIEKAVLDLQFQELESDILENPGGLEPWLVRRRRRE